MFVEKVYADVLCIGGGIASLMTAIRASELGSKVVVADKSNPLYSGSGGMGNDHFLCYIPEVHGNDITPVVKAVQGSVSGGMRHIDFLHDFLEGTHDIIKLWDNWGIPMTHEGRYEFAGHAIPGRPLIFLHYYGQDQKKVLTREARKRGVALMGRVMVFDLLARDGVVVGALGIDTREDKLIVFQARSVVMATGRCVRLYPPPVPAWMFNVAHSPCSTGDGMAMAYRAGAEAANVEIASRWAGPRYLARCGKASWVGVLRDPQGNPVGPFITKPDKRHGDAISDIYPTLFSDYSGSARVPVYMDCGGISDEDYEYMLHFMKHEGLTSLLDSLKEEGVDLRKNQIEFGTYQMMPAGGVYHDEKGETVIKGLFVAGDEAYSSGGISMAATTGWMIGEAAAGRAKAGETPDMGPVQSVIEEKEHFIHELQVREDGPDWKEVNIALQQLMYDYAGEKRTAVLLEAGLRYLGRLKEKTNRSMIARNRHELMHCLEVLNMLDIGEVLFIAADERKETRGNHRRPDYPFTNPLLDKFLLVRNDHGKPVTEWREVRR